VGEQGLEELRGQVGAGDDEDGGESGAGTVAREGDPASDSQQREQSAEVAEQDDAGRDRAGAGAPFGKMAEQNGIEMLNRVRLMDQEGEDRKAGGAGEATGERGSDVTSQAGNGSGAHPLRPRGEALRAWHRLRQG
jgi:hypothetical protein